MRRSDGFILVVTLLITVALAILVFGTLFTSVIDRTVSANQQGASSSRFIAEAGLQDAKTQIFRYLVAYFESADEGWCESPLTEEFGYEEITLNEDDADCDDGWCDFGPGRYRVTLNLTDSYVVLTSVGQVGRSQSTAQLVATSGGGPASAWDNAIFAEGTDPNAKAITGNVAVYGSVHIVLGEIEIADDAFEDISVTGTAGIFNNYEGKRTANTDIRDDLQWLTGDRDVDLCTRVKIERGEIYLDSNASRVGTLDNPIYSVHLGEGRVFRGKKGAGAREIEDHNDSDRINLRYPATGVSTSYEGYELKLPRLPVGYPDDIEGAFDLDLALENGSDHDESADSCDWLVQGDVVKLPPLDPSSDHTCQQGQNILRWLPESEGQPARIRFERTDDDDVPVIVNTRGFGVEITETEEYGAVFYEGKGAIRSGGCHSDPDTVVRDGKSIAVCRPNPDLNADITIDGSFKPVANTYLKSNMIGLVTTGDMNLGISAQTTIAALAYAAGTIHTDKQTLVVGSLVASKFDIGNQVPKVAWHEDVPDAATFLKMPGALVAEADGEETGASGANRGVFRNISLEWRETPL